MLADTARDFGAAAASAFGAGFGGCVWALVCAGEAADFLQRWSNRYHARFPNHVSKSRFFTSPAGPAAFILNLSTESAGV